MRDCVLNIDVNGHVCEVEVHLAEILRERANAQAFTDVFNELFSGAGGK